MLFGISVVASLITNSQKFETLELKIKTESFQWLEMRLILIQVLTSLSTIQKDIRYMYPSPKPVHPMLYICGFFG